MCGACGTGRAAAPWEDVLAGAGPAHRAARAAAAGRLLTGRRLRVTPWRGGYLLTTATGAARPVASLDELWTAAPRPATGEPRWARAPAPPGWDLQAAVVWVSAAARAGTLTAAALPGGRVVEFRDGRAAHVAPSSGTAEVGVRGREPEAALAHLVAFAGHRGGGTTGPRRDR
ncbi:hypothetical protein [Geodermatophilus sp. SYSU D01176]